MVHGTPRGPYDPLNATLPRYAPNWCSVNDMLAGSLAKLHHPGYDCDPRTQLFSDRISKSQAYPTALALYVSQAWDCCSKRTDQTNPP